MNTDRMIGMTILTKTEEEWLDSFADLSELVREQATKDRHVSMWTSSSQEVVDDEEELHYDDHTLVKVREAIRKTLDSDPYSSPSEQMVTDIIAEIKNTGILFRERSR